MRLVFNLFVNNYHITITILDIIHRPVFYLKHGVSETEFCLQHQVERTQVAPIDRARLCLPDTSNNTNRIYKANTTQTTNESWLCLCAYVFKLQIFECFVWIRVTERTL
jgi:hypothetical protein